MISLSSRAEAIRSNETSSLDATRGCKRRRGLMQPYSVFQGLQNGVLWAVSRYAGRDPRFCLRTTSKGELPLPLPLPSKSLWNGNNILPLPLPLPLPFTVNELPLPLPLPLPFER